MLLPLETARSALRSVSAAWSRALHHIAIQQCQGVIGCHEPRLQAKLSRFEEMRPKLQRVQLVHVKREFNAPADHKAARAAKEGRFVVEEVEELEVLERLNKLPGAIAPETGSTNLDSGTSRPRSTQADLASSASDLGGATDPRSNQADLGPGTSDLGPRTPNPGSEKADLGAGASDLGLGVLEPKSGTSDPRSGRMHLTSEQPRAEMFVVQTRQRSRAAKAVVGSAPKEPTEVSATMDPHGGNSDDLDAILNERWRRIRAHQDADRETRHISRFLQGRLAELTREEASQVAKVAELFELDDKDVLCHVGPLTRKQLESSRPMMRLVTPKELRSEVLHVCHQDFQGGHQGIQRTFEQVRREYYWREMFRDVERHVRECVDCATYKSGPRKPGPSPGNVSQEYPFQYLSMDFVTSQNRPRETRHCSFFRICSRDTCYATPCVTPPLRPPQKLISRRSSSSSVRRAT